MRLLLRFTMGLAIGFLSLWLGDLGTLTMVLLLALLILYHLRRGQLGSASALAVGAGGVVTLLLGAVVLSTITDPAVHTETPTVLAFIVGLLVASSGVTLGIVGFSRRTQARP
jgi:hypothetical protein